MVSFIYPKGENSYIFSGRWDQAALVLNIGRMESCPSHLESTLWKCESSAECHILDFILRIANPTMIWEYSR